MAYEQELQQIQNKREEIGQAERSFKSARENVGNYVRSQTAGYRPTSIQELREKQKVEREASNRINQDISQKETEFKKEFEPVKEKLNAAEQEIKQYNEEVAAYERDKATADAYVSRGQYPLGESRRVRELYEGSDTVENFNKRKAAIENEKLNIAKLAGQYDVRYDPDQPLNSESTRKTINEINTKVKEELVNELKQGKNLAFYQQGNNIFIGAEATSKQIAQQNYQELELAKLAAKYDVKFDRNDLQGTLNKVNTKIDAEKQANKETMVNALKRGQKLSWDTQGNIYVTGTPKPVTVPRDTQNIQGIPQNQLPYQSRGTISGNILKPAPSNKFYNYLAAPTPTPEYKPIPKVSSKERKFPSMQGWIHQPVTKFAQVIDYGVQKIAPNFYQETLNESNKHPFATNTANRFVNYIADPIATWTLISPGGMLKTSTTSLRAATFEVPVRYAMENPRVTFIGKANGDYLSVVGKTTIHGKPAKLAGYYTIEEYKGGYKIIGDEYLIQGTKKKGFTVTETKTFSYNKPLGNKPKFVSENVLYSSKPSVIDTIVLKTKKEPIINAQGVFSRGGSVKVRTLVVDAAGKGIVYDAEGAVAAKSKVTGIGIPTDKLPVNVPMDKGTLTVFKEGNYIVYAAGEPKLRIYKGGRVSQIFKPRITGVVEVAEDTSVKSLGKGGSQKLRAIKEVVPFSTLNVQSTTPTYSKWNSIQFQQDTFTAIAKSASAESAITQIRPVSPVFKTATAEKVQLSRVKPAQNVSSINAQKQETKLKTILSEKTLQTPVPALSTSTIQSTQNVQRTLTKPKLDLASKIAQRYKLQYKVDLKQQTKAQSKLKPSSAISKSYNRISSKFIFGKRSNEDENTINEDSLGKYSSFTKRFGKWKKIGESSDLDVLLRKSRKSILSDLSRSLKVTKEGQTIKVPGQFGFRPSRADSKIQVQANALSNRAETKEIQYFRKKKQKSGGWKWF